MNKSLLIAFAIISASLSHERIFAGPVVENIREYIKMYGIHPTNEQGLLNLTKNIKMSDGSEISAPIIASLDGIEMLPKNIRLLVIKGTPGMTLPSDAFNKAPFLSSITINGKFYMNPNPYRREIPGYTIPDSAIDDYLN